MHAYAYILIVCKFHSVLCMYDDNTRKSPAGVGGCGGRCRLCPEALSGMCGPCGESWRSGESRREDRCQTFNPASRFSPTCVPHLQAGAPVRREPVPEHHKYQQNQLAPSGSPSLPPEDSPKTPSLAHSTDRYDPLTSPPPTRDTVFSPPRYLLSIALSLTPPATWHVSV